MLLKSTLSLLPGAGLLLLDGMKKHANLKARQVPVTRLQVYTAIIRGNLSFVYHCCSFISRYYLILVPLVWLLSPTTAAIMIGMHLTAGIVEYTVKKPRLNPISFLFFFTLEQASYQSGVWWECIQRVNFSPVLPRIIHKRA